MKPQKYTKIPVEIEAMQWTRNTTMREMYEFTNGLTKINDVGDEFEVYDRLHDTWVKFGWDDYIIKGVKGEFYPCAKDVFEETYKPVVKKRDSPKKRESNDPERPPKGPGSGSGGVQIHFAPNPNDPAIVASQVRRALFDPYGRRA